MEKRGRQALEEKIGIERFKQLLENNQDISDISVLVCEHEITEERKRHCEACRRAIYRAKERIQAANVQDKTFQPIDDFAKIPEIAKFKEFMQARGAKSNQHLSQLFRMWTWIRDSGKAELVETQRPIMWNTDHVQFLRIKIDELRVSKYAWIQSLRQFFASAKRYEMLNDPMLKARRRDMRSPDGANREIDRFTIDEFITEILPILNDQEAFAVKLHVTLKCREGDHGQGSLLDLKWSDIDFSDNFYGFPTATARVYEPKTAGGTTWEHCPINLWFSDLSLQMSAIYQANHPTPSDYVLHYTYAEYLEVWAKISAAINKRFQPHDCRRSPSGWLRDLGLSDLAIGQYDARTGKATGFSGVGWENAEIFFQRYGKMNPMSIFNMEKRTLPEAFTGLIRKLVKP